MSGEVICSAGGRQVGNRGGDPPADVLDAALRLPDGFTTDSDTPRRRRKAATEKGSAPG
jgi:hypothetical protein